LDLRDFLFRTRGFTPLPFLIAALIWARYHPPLLFAGFAVALLGELLRIHSIRFAGGATRTRQVGAPGLVTDGPYGMVRNPLYLANMLIYTGFGVASGAWFPWLPLAGLIYFGFQYGMIISLEECRLRELFGATYAEYCRRVPRLIPSLFAGIKGVPRYSLREALHEERRTLQSFGIAWLLLLLKLTLLIKNLEFRI
jgi:protein-S-isoprenylcysteine O-methyltransferase Ste14